LVTYLKSLFRLWPEDNIKLIDVAFWWLENIWKICLGFPFPEYDMLLVEVVLCLYDIWKVCFGFGFPKYDLLFIDDAFCWLDEMWKAYFSYDPKIDKLLLEFKDILFVEQEFWRFEDIRKVCDVSRFPEYDIVLLECCKLFWLLI